MTQSALVMGLGRSGVAAATLLQKQGYQTVVIDEGDGSASLEMREQLHRLHVEVLARQSVIPSGHFDLVVVSPGIACDNPLVISAQAACEEVISELELGYRYCACPILAVTGTNGKSTLVELLHHILCESGMRSQMAGNIGTPLCALVSESGVLDWLVVEVSSFQLECVQSFHPRGAVFLNLQPDHLDRHQNMERYFSLKCRLFARMEKGDIGVVLHDLLPSVQRTVSESGQSGGPDWIGFGNGARTWRYDAATHAVIGPAGEGGDVSVSVQHTYFDNVVTGQTAAAAVALAVTCVHLSASEVGASLRTFRPLPHRIEIVAEFGGVVFVDDSKATNMAAMEAALSMQNRPVHLIAGGVLKEKDVFGVKQVLKKHASFVYLIGEAAPYLAAAWGDLVPVLLCGTLEEAIENVFVRVQDGDVVLLSPGCASFDQFRSYAERGERFASLVTARKQKT